MAGDVKWKVKHDGKLLGEYSEAEIRARYANGIIPEGSSVSREGISDTNIEIAFPINPTDAAWKFRIEHYVEKCTNQQQKSFQQHLETQLKHLKWVLAVIGLCLSAVFGTSIYSTTTTATKQIDATSNMAKINIKALLKTTELQIKNTARETANKITEGVDEELNTKLETVRANTIKRAKESISTDIDDSKNNAVEKAKKDITTHISAVKKEAVDTAINSINKEAIKVADEIKNDIAKHYDKKVMEELREEFVATIKTSKVDDFEKLSKKLTKLVRKEVGLIMPFSGPKDKIPSGWLSCDGSSRLRQGEFQQLFEVIGTSWGKGDGDNKTFSIPDLRGMFLRGVDHSSGKDPDVELRKPLGTGEKYGVGSVQSFATSLPRTKNYVTNIAGNHSHKINEGAGDRDGGYLDSKRKGQKTQQGGGIVASGEHHHEIIGGGDKETRPINAYINWIIKY